MTSLDQYLEQFRGDVDPLAVCRERGWHNWYDARGIYGHWAECRDCHVRLQEPHEHAPDRMNWLEYHMQRLDGELRGRANHEDYIAMCRAKGRHEWYKLVGGYQCRQCGLQFATPEPYDTNYPAEYLAQMNKLDAELRNT